jgi:hypothetical protein
MRGFKSDSPRVEDLIGKTPPENGDHAGRGLTNGIFQRPEVSFDGKTIYFAWAELTERSRDKTTGPEFISGPYHLFRVDSDGTGLRQLTFGPKSDLEPCELPNGRILFCSTRRDSGDRCCMMNRTSFFLHAMKPDGSDIVCLSFHETHEWEPSVDHNGMVVYTRWDYVDRSMYHHHNLWLTRPDGTNPVALWGNGVWSPRGMSQAKAIPGSQRLVFVGTGHHFATGGGLAARRAGLVHRLPRADDDGGLQQAFAGAATRAVEDRAGLDGRIAFLLHPLRPADPRQALRPLPRRPGQD